MKVLFSFIFLLIVANGCSDHSTNTKSGFDGNWNLTYEDDHNIIPITIETGENYLMFGNAKYEGEYSGNTFEGNYHYTRNNVDSDELLTITLENINEIKGQTERTLTFKDSSEVRTFKFTGTRVD